MNNPYATLPDNWTSSSSKRGLQLIKYAQRVLDVLKKGFSVQFASDQAVQYVESGEGVRLRFLSGGTSGQPEFVEHNHGTLQSAVGGLASRIGDQAMNSICCLPLWHVGGWMQLERAWSTGGKVYFCDYRDLENPKVAAKVSGNLISLVPAQLHELMKSPTAITALSEARGIFVGGAGMNSHLVDVSRSLNLPVCPCYGSSETAGMITLLESSSFLVGINGVGPCLPHAEVRLSEKNQQVLIKSSSLCIRRGKRTFATNEWLQTPDFGKIDPSGNLIIEGRLDRLINTGGEKVDPTRIETILHSTGLIENCLVYGVSDQKWGQRVVACITPADVNLKYLKQEVKKKLLGPMMPKEWIKTDKIPMSEMGKPNYTLE
ncbi:AMP-binding protein [Candidatus Chordibacter forsetii]|jgi:o-succinylbenzoate---CoA ligase|uniref:AMP-binding protein n=1 Tax=Candidatus Chordibacter forsetii TaxID=3381758 RepID=UPI0023167941|nr:AMP-binding protein [Opitutales bacterium]